MADEYILDSPTARRFIDEVRSTLDRMPVAEALEALRPAFAALLAVAALAGPARIPAPPASGERS
jgi:hypothetical protein